MFKKVDNPYKLLFSIGIISGLLGVFIWPFFNYRIIGFYPKQAHSQIMFFSFFWSFVAGFLMTAIPRMTGSKFATRLDLFWATLLVIVQCILNYTELYKHSYLIYLLQILFLIYFVVPRFLEKKKIPFDGFLFFPAAFTMCLVGIVSYYFSEDSRFLVIIAGEAFLTNLIVGLGSRLIPALSRIPNASMHPGMVTPLNFKGVTIKAILLNLSFLLELFFFLEVAYLLRLLVVGFIAIKSFGLFKKGSAFSMLAVGLKISIVFMLISYVFKIIFIQHSLIAHSHLLYIGGLSLLTLMIATRVTLAHSQTNLNYEFKSILIFSIVMLLSMAAIFRWISNFNFSGAWLYLSIFVFAIGVLIWLWKHLSLVRSSNIQKD